MSKIIRAIVQSNSSEDANARVKISAEGVYPTSSESPLIHSVGGIPLKKGDVVFVDISNILNPLILGRSMHSNNSFKKDLEGSLLFESADDSEYTFCSVKPSSLNIYNSNGVEIKIDSSGVSIKTSSSVTIKSPKVKVTGGQLQVSGTVTPGTSGPFNCLTTCAYTGAPHAGNIVMGT